jgi:hypothetical protein
VLSSIVEFVEFEIAPTEIPREPPILLGNSQFVLQELDCGESLFFLHFRQGSLIKLVGAFGHSALPLGGPSDGRPKRL